MTQVNFAVSSVAPVSSELASMPAFMEGYAEGTSAIEGFIRWTKRQSDTIGIAHITASRQKRWNKVIRILDNWSEGDEAECGFQLAYVHALQQCMDDYHSLTGLRPTFCGDKEYGHLRTKIDMPFKRILWVWFE